VVTIPAGTANGTYNVKVTVTNTSGTGANQKNDVKNGVVVVNVTTNVAPLVAANNASVTVNEGQTATNTGTWSDANAGDTVTLSASVGAVTKSGTNASGTWSWSFTTTDGPADSQTVTITANDGNGGVATTTFSLTVSNVAPTATFGNNGPVDEGSPILLSLTSPSDPSSADTTAGFTYAFDCDDGSGYGAFGASNSTTCPTTDNGTRTVKGKIKDKDGGQTEYTASVTVSNVAPTATFAATSPINEGSSSTLSLTSPSDSSTTDTAAGFHYSFACDGLDASLAATYAAAGTASTTTCPFGDNGSFTVKGRIFDKDNGSTTYSATVVVNNVPPTATLSNNGPVDEGSPATVSFSNQFDPSSADTAAGFHYAFSCTNGDLSGATYAGSGTSTSTTCTFTDNGSYTVRARIIDKDGGFTEYTTAVVVNNVPPVLTAVTGPSAPVQVNTAVTVTATFTDAGSADTHSCTFSWDDATSSPGSVTEAGGNGSCTGMHTFAGAGVYAVTVTVTDDDGGSDTETFQYVVVYDPSAGFVTGGGWITSLPGAYTATPSLTGKATFGFVSKYKKGATVPTGETEFQFQVAGFNFHSTVYEWLVVSGAKAQYKGSGTVNGAGDYGFLLTATDGQLAGGGGVDKFRIKIWDKTANSIVYDNVPDASDDIDTANPQAIGGGSIVIHK
jgi:hypothetical protein